MEDQDRRLWRRKLIQEGLALIDKAMRHRRTGIYLVQAAIAALHARAMQFADTDWAGIDALYATLEQLQPSPVVTLNRAVAVSKTKGPQAALDMIEPLAERLSGHLLSRREGRTTAAARPEERARSFDRALRWAARRRRRISACILTVDRESVSVGEAGLPRGGEYGSSRQAHHEA
jgi:RNA polymerase sigma-70 factor (ECF subfamily)